MVVSGILAANLIAQPYLKQMYDCEESFTSAVELTVLLLGLLAVHRAESSIVVCMGSTSVTC